MEATGGGRSIAASRGYRFCDARGMTRHTALVFLAFVALALSSGCTAAPRQRPVEMGPVAEGAGSLAAARKYLEGSWILESFEIFPPGKPAMKLVGSGTLSYDKYSNLRMELRPDKASANILRDAGVKVPDDDRFSTDGRTAVDLENHKITYVLDGKAPGSGPLALSRPRYWQVENDMLTLTTKDDSGNPVSVGRWRKAPAQ
jgi:hypothetical protein